MQCPKCGFEQREGMSECSRCGLIFARWRDPGLFAGDGPPVQTSWTSFSEENEAPVVDGRLGMSEIRILGIGLVAALVAYFIPFTRFILSALVTLFHEFGHAVVSWLFGTPALPAFDFVYGGGLTHTGEFHRSIALAIFCGIAWLGWIVRENRRLLSIVIAFAAVWLFIVSSDWRREVAFAAAGHTGEFVLAGILFYQALAGIGWRMPDVERPLGAFVAFFVELNFLGFCRSLQNDPAFLAWYREGKGGALMNDLEIVALDLHIWTGHTFTIQGVARAMSILSFAPFLIALVWYFWRAKWRRVLFRIEN